MTTNLLVDDRILKQAHAWCGMHGLMYTDGDITWTPAPISLVPNTFPKESFAFLKKIQPIWNVLMDRISRDRPFILQELKNVVGADEFTQRVLQIYENVPETVVQNSLQLGIFRSDYMLDTNKDGVSKPLQVEINTVASSFGSLAHKVQRFHVDFLTRNGQRPDINSILTEVISPATLTHEEVLSRLQDNQSLQNIAAGLAAAHHAYLTSTTTVSSSSEARNCRILFIVQSGEKNQGDQRALEQELWSTHHIQVEFIPFNTLSSCLSLSNDNRLLLTLDNKQNVMEISVAYYRAGYTPDDYTSNDGHEWTARTTIEQSIAIKCPSVGLHLAGTKAIQAALCKPGVLERFLNLEESEMLRQCFAMQYSLGDPTMRSLAQPVIQAAIEDGSTWVLKPQREGGGNNYYGEKLSLFLKQHSAGKETRGVDILSGYVLMQRIFPALQQAAFLRKGNLVMGPSLSEVGIYGTYLSDGQNQLVNEFCGYLVRTKAEGVDEGGVATGYSVLNSLLLVD